MRDRQQGDMATAIDSWKNEVHDRAMRFRRAGFPVSLEDLEKEDLSAQDRKDISQKLVDIMNFWQAAMPGVEIDFGTLVQTRLEVRKRLNDLVKRCRVLEPPKPKVKKVIKKKKVKKSEL